MGITNLSGKNTRRFMSTESDTLGTAQKESQLNLNDFLRTEKDEFCVLHGPGVSVFLVSNIFQTKSNHGDLCDDRFERLSN